MKLWDEHVAYLKDNPEGYWFKRKLYGYGWTPAKPAGWLLTFGYMLLVIGGAVCAERTDLFDLEPQKFITAFILLTILFLVIVWRTGEPAKWQWGRRDEQND